MYVVVVSKVRSASDSLLTGMLTGAATDKDDNLLILKSPMKFHILRNHRSHLEGLVSIQLAFSLGHPHIDHQQVTSELSSWSPFAPDVPQSS
jgi:hypothetical protein